MVFSSDGLGDLVIETATSKTGEEFSDFSVVVLSDNTVALEFFRNLSESVARICFLDCGRGPNFVTSTLDCSYVIEQPWVLDESAYPSPR